VSKITAIRAGKGRQQRVNLFLDGKFAISMDTEVVTKAQLKTGQELTSNQMAALHKSDRIKRCLNAALHYLSYRPRSEAETRERLQQRGFDNESIEATLTKLKEQTLIDDAAFAQFWKDNRQAFSPRSQRLTRLELSRKGIAADTINGVVGEIDDQENAYRAALNKAQRLPLSDHSNFRRRLSYYLKSRGFNYEVTNYTVERLWQERESNNTLP